MLAGTYFWSKGQMPLTIRETSVGFEAISGHVKPFPWDRGAFLDVKNNTIRLEGVFMGEIQPLFGTLLSTARIDWSDGTYWFKQRHA